MPVCDFAHVPDYVNQHILCMLDGPFPLDTAHTVHYNVIINILLLLLLLFSL